jgi:hypothetical protein
MDDDAFLARFESASIPLEEWNHKEHLRVAWTYLRRHGLEGATERMREGIRRFNASKGIEDTLETRYHETLTVAWLRILDTQIGDPMPEAQPSLMLIVRGMKSRLPREELVRRLEERMPRFRDVSGLVQKYYAYDPATEEWAGIYLWESEEAAGAYLASDLRKTIASAYELEKPPRIERFPIVQVLRA